MSKKLFCKQDWDYKRPPIGLVPKHIRQKERFLEICKAISKYYNAGCKIPVEWIKEYNELVDFVKK